MNARFLSISGLLALALIGPAHADDASTLPGPGFSADRYATLWTKSPFAIATPEAAVASQDYELVGVAQFDGVSYASLIDKQANEHFVLASDKPVRNLTLVSVSHGPGGATAIIQRNGELLTLKQESAPAGAPSPSQSVVLAPGTPMPTFPPMNQSVGGMPATMFRHPVIRMHRPPIAVPPAPGSQ